MTRVLLVGLGAIARTHLAVLDARADVEVVAGVDPAPSYVVPFPVHATLAEGLAHDPDLVVLATPTPTHVPLTREVLAAGAARVLSEKPLAGTLAELDGLPEERVAVAHHFAFSPEVTWARRYVEAHGLGPVRGVLAIWQDAYGDRVAARAASTVSSWLDSGPNQLSVLSPFLTGMRVRAHRERPERAATVLEHGGGTATLTSSWLAGDSSKQTSLRYHGAEVRMDHTSMTALVTAGDRVVAHAAYTGALGRKEAHYTGLYDALLSGAADPRLGVPLAREVARLLEEAALAPPLEVAWTDVAD